MRREQNIPQETLGLIDLINTQELILAKVQLPDLTEMPNYNQFLIVKDNNIALSIGYLKVLAKRILIHKTSGEELDLNLPVPDWERTESDFASLVNPATGERLLFETNYYDDEDNLVETTQEDYKVPVLHYLKLMISQMPYASVFQSFTMQYVADVEAAVPNYFSMLNPPKIAGKNE